MDVVGSVANRTTRAPSSDRKVRPTLRRRVACYVLGVVAAAVGFAVVTPLAAGAQQPERIETGFSTSGIAPNSLSEMVSYNKGFATVGADKAGDILLFTKVAGAASWARTEIYDAAGDGVGMFGPVVATSGKNLAIVAYEDGTYFLFSWIGNVAHGFTAHVVSGSASFALFTPSVAYSPLGKNS